MRKKTALPHRHLHELLPSFLERIENRVRENPTAVLQGWQEVIETKWAGMTHACSFEKGTVVVKVKNAALYSLLVQQEGNRLLKKLQQKFPKSGVQKIHFRRG